MLASGALIDLKGLSNVAFLLGMIIAPLQRYRTASHRGATPAQYQAMHIVTVAEKFI